MSATAAPVEGGAAASGIPGEEALRPAHHEVIVVGAGPVGLALSIDLAQRGVSVVLLDKHGSVTPGSRSVCHAKRTLEILDRLGCGEQVTSRGVSWSVGKVYFRDSLVYAFNLLSEAGHRRPAFVNLQEHHLETILLGRAIETGRVDLRWNNRVQKIEQDAGQVRLGIATPGGGYSLSCDWLVACDGADSPVRRALGLECQGQSYEERFLIADVRMKADYPTERRFWFDPPFHPGRSALLHRQADNVWRVDLQLGPDVDPQQESDPERVRARLQAMLGERDLDLDWVSVESFGCRRLERFRHGRVLFAGDAAHQLSPFGARGTNSGFQDADNLAWKLNAVLEGRAPQRLLDSYSDERVMAADENILNATRSTEFITPGSRVSRVFRDAVLGLAGDFPFARRLVNSGRLSQAAVFAGSALNTADSDAFHGGVAPGAPMADAPVAVNGRLRWLLDCVGGRFAGLYFACGLQELPAEVASGIAVLTLDRIAVDTCVVVEHANPIELPPGVMKLEDIEDFVVQRCDATPGCFYLLRPDQYVCARWRGFILDRVREAVRRATCNL